MMWIIEHLESGMFPWCVLEYRHIAQVVGKKCLMFTNVKKGAEQLKKFGNVYQESVRELLLHKACVLDPAARQIVSSKDHFEYIILGGILGDHPPRARTQKELSRLVKFPKRNLGKKQFSTDTAVLVAQELLLGKSLQSLSLQDGITIPLNKIESVDLPFTYIIKNGQPVLPAGLKRYLCHRKEF